MARNKLGDLNNHLFEQIERLMDDSLDEDELEREIKRSRAVSQVSQSIVDVAALGLRATIAVNNTMTATAAKKTLPEALGGGHA